MSSRSDTSSVAPLALPSQAAIRRRASNAKPSVWTQYESVKTPAERVHFVNLCVDFLTDPGQMIPPPLVTPAFVEAKRQKHAFSIPGEDETVQTSENVGSLCSTAFSTDRLSLPLHTMQNRRCGLCQQIMNSHSGVFGVIHSTSPRPLMPCCQSCHQLASQS